MNRYVLQWFGRESNPRHGDFQSSSVSRWRRAIEWIQGARGTLKGGVEIPAAPTSDDDVCAAAYRRFGCP